MRHYSLFIGFIIAFGLSAWTQPVEAQSGPQKLAPGVLNVIEPAIDPRDTHSLPMSTPGIDAPAFTPQESSIANTLAYQAKSIVLFRNVWHLEYSFLELRQIEIDVPASDGSTVKRNYWYMVWQIRNTGKVLVNEEIRDPKFNMLEYDKRANFEGMTAERRQELVEEMKRETLYTRFIGNFRLEGWVENITTAEYTQVIYKPVVDPSVIAAIRQEEDPATELLTSVAIMKKSLPMVSEKSKFGGLWGVTVWENVDPRIDFVSVYVNGLTNAYRLKPKADGEWETVQKTLQLNFWRPGDAINQSGDVVDYGIPMTEDYRRQIQICDRYNLPGPMMEGFEVNPETTRKRQLIEIDGLVSLKTLKSALAADLDSGTVSPTIAEAFQNAGSPLPDGVNVQTTIVGRQWKIETQINGENKTILLQLTPQYWEPAPDGKSIRFTESLDHLWIYQ